MKTLELERHEAALLVEAIELAIEQYHDEAKTARPDVAESMYAECAELVELQRRIERL